MVGGLYCTMVGVGVTTQGRGRTARAQHGPIYPYTAGRSGNPWTVDNAKVSSVLRQLAHRVHAAAATSSTDLNGLR